MRGRSVLVVGASAGIGRAFALAAVAAGAQVTLSARRADLLDAAVAEAGGGTAIAADVCVEGDAARLVEAAAVANGAPLDLVFYAVGVAPLAMLVDTTADQWRRVFETNVLGLHQLLRAAVPNLEPGGVVAVLSSETVGRPRSGLGVYGSSKAAVDESLRAWQLEHPELRFSCIAVGATQPTDFGADFDGELLPRLLDHWVVNGLMQQEFMATNDVARVLCDTFGVALDHPGVGIEHVRLRSPSAVAGDWGGAKS